VGGFRNFLNMQARFAGVRDYNTEVFCVGHRVQLLLADEVCVVRIVTPKVEHNAFLGMKGHTPVIAPTDEVISGRLEFHAVIYIGNRPSELSIISILRD